MRSFFLLIFTLVTILFSIDGSAQSNEELIRDLNSRIEALEKQQDELFFQSQTSSNQVSSFLKDNLAFGGFLDTAVTAVEGPDTNLKVMNSSNLLGINLAADFSPRLHFVSQFLTGLIFPVSNPNNNPALPADREFGSALFGAVLTQGYLEYSFSNHLKLQGGIGYAPFGYAFQQRELVLFARRGGPQLLRTQQLASTLWNGLHLLGTHSLKNKGRWGYDLYTTNPIDPAINNVMGLGGRTWISSSEEKIVAGLSAQAGKFRNSTDAVYGADLKIDFKNFMLITEYARHSTDGNDPWSAYIEPGVFLRDETWLIFIFGDYADSPLSTLRLPTGVQASDRYQKWEYGAGINWLPTAYTRLRLTLTNHDYVGDTASIDYRDRDYHSLDISVGVAF